MPRTFGNPTEVMQHAIRLARQGAGAVEPNPMVGAVIVDDALNLLGEGSHQHFGGPHAEVFALKQAGALARGATLYVTLEPCCHVGKTPPCAAAVIAAGIRKVVIGLVDPFPKVAGGGVRELLHAGVALELGLLEADVRRLNAPYLKLTQSGLSWVHAKWAMTLDGKIAARTGASRWITGEESRARVHGLRGRMDAIIVGSGTALADDPLLTARPAGPRVPARIVLDSRARLPSASKLLATAHEAPVIIAVSEQAAAGDVRRLAEAGAEVLPLRTCGEGDSSGCESPASLDLLQLLQELGKRRFTNILVEGGEALLGSFHDRKLIDELHVFIAPKLLGGAAAKSPLGGLGLAEPSASAQIANPEIEMCGADLYVHGALLPATP